VTVTTRVASEIKVWSCQGSGGHGVINLCCYYCWPTTTKTCTVWCLQVQVPSQPGLLSAKVTVSQDSSLLEVGGYEEYVEAMNIMGATPRAPLASSLQDILDVSAISQNRDMPDVKTPPKLPHVTLPRLKTWIFHLCNA